MSSWLNSLYETEEQSDADKHLTVAAVIVEEMRAAVYQDTGFRCSAGIAHNKVVKLLPSTETSFLHICNIAYFLCHIKVHQY